MEKTTYKYLSYASLGVLAFALYKLYQFNKTAPETTSSFNGNDDEQISFILTNNTPKTQTAYLFNGYTDQSNPSVGVNGNLDFFNRELVNQPKKVSKIEFRAMGNTNQAETPFVINCKDANGNANTTQYIPLVDANQYQGNITSVNMNNLLLNGECYMEYTMNPSSIVNIVVYYTELNN